MAARYLLLLNSLIPLDFKKYPLSNKKSLLLNVFNKPISVRESVFFCVLQMSVRYNHLMKTVQVAFLVVVDFISKFRISSINFCLKISDTVFEQFYSFFVITKIVFDNA
ncbi:hypothetical protein DRF58_12985 [Epilithonimonas hispanica]|uniref:Uncharacterized protein n=1 Tax=Epilithonimonas hispanica TaxID=358687 RepID=A0A3D9CTP9_9FLAO|nr:hypothetical protein DRF58_12985 [Epilithonimonas hispanica]